MLKKVLLAISLFLLLGCSEDAPVNQASQPTKSAPATATAEVAASDHLLVFFLDPNGGPCRMQASILDGMSAELKGKVQLRYVQTTVQDDLQYFYAYGIRGLPSLLLADATGREIKRLPPGVNPVERVRELLQAIPN